jgi:thiol:disulfide interchange protein DsbD
MHSWRLRKKPVGFDGGSKMKQTPDQKETLLSLCSRAWIVILLASAQVSAATIPHGTVNFDAEDQWITPGRQFYLSLLFRLEDGWHIYWVNPGDSGQPPRAQWRLPPGFTAGEFEWPAPKRFGASTIVDFGYDGTATLLVPIRAAASLKPNQQVQLGLALDVLVCREICIPGKAQLSVSLPIKSMSPEPDSRTRDIFAAARKTLPRMAPSDWSVEAIDANGIFILVASVGRKTGQAVFFPLNESEVDNAAPQRLDPTPRGFRLTLHKSELLLKPIHRLRGVLELSPNESYIIDAPVKIAAASKPVK